MLMKKMMWIDPMDVVVICIMGLVEVCFVGSVVGGIL